MHVHCRLDLLHLVRVCSTSPKVSLDSAGASRGSTRSRLDCIRPTAALWRMRVRALLLALVLSLVGRSAACTSESPVVQSIVDYCISSRWGFSCFPPRSGALIDLSGGRLAAAMTAAGRTSARGALLVGSTFIAREIFRDVRSLKHADVRDIVSSGFGREEPPKRRHGSVKAARARSKHRRR